MGGVASLPPVVGSWQEASRCRERETGECGIMEGLSKEITLVCRNLVNVGAPFGVYKREFSPAAMPRPSLHYC
jgi:hypothetical protein